jgi:16S rRNA (guanine966-N2)-methyltransferase
MDPPYAKQKNREILNLISDYELVEKDGMVLIESLKEDEFHEEYEHLQFEKDRVYGISRITWYRGK